jgi:hypothetical protein
MRHRRTAGLSLAAALCAGLVAVTSAASTDASWTTAETGTGSFTAGVVGPPRTLTCTQSAQSGPVFDWVEPAAGGLPVSSYHWALTDNTSAVVASGDVTSPTATPAPDGTLATGTYTFSVVSTGPGGWTSVPGLTGTYTVAIGPAFTCTVP